MAIKVIYIIVLIIFLSEVSMAQEQLKPCPETPNCVSSMATDAGHRIEPLPFIGDMERAKQAVRDALAQLPRTQIITDENNFIHATQTSLIFRFVDDIHFLFDEENKVVHVRSASRVGRSDLGVNRKRVEKIRGILK